MAVPVITLTTDFGLSDHYVGVMKGVILGIHAEARIVDVCHQVEPYDILGGAMTLAAAYAYFPAESVHLVVVDPGVGTKRRPILARAGSWWFVAPDNGVLELVYQQHPAKVWALEAQRFALQPVSNTFHGRDVFAPAAALVSKNTTPEQLGYPIDDFERLDVPHPRRRGNGVCEGAVLKVDRFGNLVTNLQLADLPTNFLIRVGDTRISTLRASYGAAAPGEVFAIVGSSGFLEISRNQASAAEATGAAAGTAVEIVDTKRME
jgi:S-adenosylmethionine hydrolase